jgi:hypothetical protein
LAVIRTIARKGGSYGPPFSFAFLDVLFIESAQNERYIFFTMLPGVKEAIPFTRSKTVSQNRKVDI